MNKIIGNSCRLLILTLTLYSSFLINDRKEVAYSQQNQFSQDTEEYYPHHPTGCAYIKKLEIEQVSSYYFIQPCSRDDRMQLQQVTAAETGTSGVIYVEEQSLSDGLSVGPGYWCSLQAPGFGNTGPVGTCILRGWIPNRPR